jgi:hypothetical protein
VHVFGGSTQSGVSMICITSKERVEVVQLLGVMRLSSGVPRFRSMMGGTGDAAGCPTLAATAKLRSGPRK